MTPTVVKKHKHLLYPPGHGYGHYVGDDKYSAGRGSNKVESIVVHTTNGNKGSSLAGETKFLLDSPKVAAHDLIGKDGTIVELLPPGEEAWHAGSAAPGFGNWLSYGIEIHFTPGEVFTPAQREALTWRVRQRMAELNIPAQKILGHRHIALPKGRKIDPSCFTDDEFFAWRAALYVPPPSPQPEPEPAPDYAAAWGDAFPYRPQWGVPALWRQHYRELGRPVTDEQRFGDWSGQEFDHGFVIWAPERVRGVYLKVKP